LPFYRILFFAVLLLLLSGCLPRQSESMFAGAKRMPGGFDALEPIGRFGIFHVVRGGDTLYSISKQYGTTIARLKAANGIIDERTVRKGARLYIPKPGEILAVKPKPKPKTPKTPPPKVFEKTLVRPCMGRIVVRFQDEIKGVPSGHIEISARAGTPVVAAKTGTVILVSQRFPGYGRAVMLQHEPGTTTLYARLGSIAVESGAVIRQGKKLGAVGSKPLVFQLSINGKVSDPTRSMGF
jgi:murein DD-endopeptidase MepM/ murein hydrolase activator NlpD